MKRMKRLLAMLLVLAMLAGMAPAVYAASFVDVPRNAWYYKAVQWAVDEGITGGTGPNTFSPDAACTRGQVVMFLWAAAGKPEPASKHNSFTDVSVNDYFYKAVLWAVQNGITGGIGDGKFGPNQPCTRAQVVTFLYAVAGKPEVLVFDSTFSDVGVNDWFREEVQWAVSNGITGGIGAGMFGPDQTCTRGQIVTFLYKADQIGGGDAPEVTPAPAEDLKIEIKTEGYNAETSGIVVQEETLTLKGSVSGGKPERIEISYADYTGEKHSAAVKGLESWSAEIPLSIGTNTVTVSAFGKAESKTEHIVFINRTNTEITYSDKVKLADESDYSALEEGVVGFWTDDMGTESAEDDRIVILVEENSLLLSQIKDGLLKQGDVYVIPENEYFVTGFSGVYQSHRAPVGTNGLNTADYPDSDYEELVFKTAEFGDLFKGDISLDFSQGVNEEDPIAYVFNGMGEPVDLTSAYRTNQLDYGPGGGEKEDEDYPQKGFQLQELAENAIPSLEIEVDRYDRVALSLNWNGIVIYDEDGKKKDVDGKSDQIKLSGEYKIKDMKYTGGIEYHPVWETPEQILAKLDYTTISKVEFKGAASMDTSDLVQFLNDGFKNEIELLGMTVSGVKLLDSKIVLGIVGLNLAPFGATIGHTIKGEAEKSQISPRLFLMLCLDLDGNLTLEGTVTSTVTSKMQKGFNVQREGFEGAFGSLADNRGDYHEKIKDTDFYLDVYDKDDEEQTLKLSGKFKAENDLGVGLSCGVLVGGFCPAMIDGVLFTRFKGEAEGEIQLMPEIKLEGFAELYAGVLAELVVAGRVIVETSVGKVGVDVYCPKSCTLWEETYSTAIFEGVVHDDSDKPIEGVTVTIINQDTKTEYSAVTDKDGKYVIKSVPSGRYTLTAKKDNYIMFREKDIDFSRELKKDITLSVSAVVKGTVTEIKIIDGEEKKVPVVGAEIKVVVHDFGDQSKVLAVTDENGTFELKLPPGNYSLIVNKDGYIAHTTSFAITDDNWDLPIVLEREKNDGADIPEGALLWNGHHYAVFDRSLNWYDAQNYCESVGGHLVTITSAEEQQLVNGLVNGTSKRSYWIGLSDEAQESKWTWVTGEAYRFSNWAQNEPNNGYGASEHYVALVSYDTVFDSEIRLGEWNDHSLDRDIEEFGFICEWEGVSEDPEAETKQLTMVEKTNDSGAGYRAVLHYNDSADLLEKITVTSVNGGDVSALEDYYYTYDSQNRLIKLETSSKLDLRGYRFMEIGYDGEGRIASLTKRDLATMDTYMEDGELRFAYEYDAQGRLIRCDGNHYDVEYAYDAQNRLTQKRKIPANKSEYASDQITKYRYEGDRVYVTMTEVKYGLEYVSYYDYAFKPFVVEAEGVDEVPTITNWYYDLGVVRSVNDELARELVEFIYPDYIGAICYMGANEPQLSYDDEGVVTELAVTYSTQGMENVRVRYYYDGEMPPEPEPLPPSGKLLTQVNEYQSDGGRREYKCDYDEKNRLIRYTETDVDNGVSEVNCMYDFRYDEQNRLISYTGTDSYEGDFEVTWTYDANGNLIRCNDTRRGDTEYFYADDGRKIGWIEYNDDRKDDEYVCEHDSAGRVIKAYLKEPNDIYSSEILEYTYNADGQLESKFVEWEGESLDQHSHEDLYYYDTEGRMIKETWECTMNGSFFELHSTEYDYTYDSFVISLDDSTLMTISLVADDTLWVNCFSVNRDISSFEESDGYLRKVTNDYYTYEFFYDGEEPEISDDTNEAAYAAYVSVVEQAKRDTEETFSLSAAEEYGIANGYLADLDGDGIDEMVLSYCNEELMGEPGETWYLGFTVYSVYDYENGQVKTVVDKERIVGHVAAMYGYAAVIEVDGKPMLMVTDEISDGTGSGTTHRYRYQFYEYPSMQTGLLLEHKEEQWSGGTDTFYVNDAVVSRNSFINELNRCSGLELGTYGVTYTDDPMTLTELQAFLK